jgi:hypothetical protein
MKARWDINCDRYALLPLDNSWPAETQLSWSSSVEENMVYGEKMQLYKSAVHITRSLTMGLESENMLTVYCVCDSRAD